MYEESGIIIVSVNDELASVTENDVDAVFVDVETDAQA
jgi:hypothetical protein